MLCNIILRQILLISIIPAPPVLNQYFFHILFILLICLAELGLHYMVGSRIFVCGGGALVPWPGLDPEPLCWEHRVSSTGPPRKSQSIFVFISHSCLRLHKDNDGGTL